MRPSSRFTVAIHVLTLLAYGAGGEPMTSEYIAGSVNTNPVVIRRLLALLRRAKLVRSQGGPGGGWRLVPAARDITLRQVFRAVESGDLFPLHGSAPNPRCPVGRTIRAALSGHYEQARRALERDLERTTIDDLLQEVRAVAR
ncbi:RrF2 family transcriptional regulator [Anaeromyxobacter oryzisoli]|uniref:RrF2 family transcriptional regulator n=1 Tax=Anaeromyxobacter oryzisoli TaxID=2925408 RepID=UPI001F59A6FB|nr:Rrf2 family transcriptional regulator [Anaeromyxobacter sp. SG63]